MLKARGGIIGFSMAPISVSLPSLDRVLKFGGKPDNANRRFPPSRSSLGSCGLMSLVVPIDPDPASTPPVSEPPQPPRIRPMARTDTARRVRAERILMDVPFLEVR